MSLAHSRLSVDFPRDLPLRLKKGKVAAAADEDFEEHILELAVEGRRGLGREHAEIMSREP